MHVLRGKLIIGKRKIHQLTAACRNASGRGSKSTRIYQSKFTVSAHRQMLTGLDKKVGKEGAKLVLKCKREEKENWKTHE